MRPEEKRFILENIGKKSPAEIARDLGLRERKVRRFIEDHCSGAEAMASAQPGDDIAQQAPGGSGPRAVTLKYRILALAVLSLLTAMIYSNTFHNAFHFDDEISIVKNLSVRDLGDLKAIWDYFPTRFITYLSVAVNYSLNRLDLPGYHLFNLAVHLAAVIFVWALTLLTFYTPGMRKSSISAYAGPMALFTALVFAAHPVQTQAVTYIIQRAASMAGLFYLGSLTLYVRARLLAEEGRGKRISGAYYAGSLVMAVLAVFSKEYTVTLPFAMLLYELVFFGGGKVKWRGLIPFAIAALAVPVTMAATRYVNFAGMHLASQTASGITPWQYLLTQFRVVITYIRLLFLPFNQNVDYDYHVSRSLADLPALLSMIAIIAVIYAAFRLLKRHKLMAFGIFWFFLVLIPESSLIPIRDVIFEHRLYLAVFGYALFLSGALYAVVGKRSVKAMMGIMLVIVACYSAMAYGRNFIWKDRYALWNDAIEKSPLKARPYNDRGNAYSEAGEYSRAIADFTRSIELNPYDAKVYSNRGTAYESIGDHDRAIGDYGKAIAIDPKLADAFNNRGNAYSSKGDYDRAITDFTRAIELNASDAMAYNNRALAYGRKGDAERAIADLDKAIELNPGAFDYYNNRGIAYDMKGDYGRALADYDKTLRINPRFANAYYNLAVLYRNTGEYGKSRENLHKAQGLGYKPDPSFLEELKAVSGE